MKLIKKSVLGAIMAAGFGLSGGAQAEVIIDLFTDPVGGFQKVTSESIGDFVSSQYGFGANIIGGYRDLDISIVSQTTAGNFSSINASGGQLSISNDDGNTSVSHVTWDGNDASATVNTTGLNGADLTVGGSDRFLANILRADLGFDYKITVWDMEGDMSALSAAVQFPVGSPGDTADFLFSWFNLANGTYCDGSQPAIPCDPATQLSFSILRSGIVDFNNIGALQIEFSNANTLSVDMAVGKISTVPEPTVLALAGIGLLGVAAFRRRKQQV